MAINMPRMYVETYYRYLDTAETEESRQYTPLDICPLDQFHEWARANGFTGVIQGNRHRNHTVHRSRRRTFQPSYGFINGTNFGKVEYEEECASMRLMNDTDSISLCMGTTEEDDDEFDSAEYTTSPVGDSTSIDSSEIWESWSTSGFDETEVSETSTPSGFSDDPCTSSGPSLYGESPDSEEGAIREYRDR